MNVNKYNSEHYSDPTAYEALTLLRKQTGFRPLVYICSPYAGDIAENVRKAREYSRFAVKQHCIPIAPHLLFPQFMNDGSKAERELALFMGMVLLTQCREVWVFGGTVSGGMALEIGKAKRRALPIRYFSDNCEEVCKDDKWVEVHG